jgi:hypothetical protein
MFSFRKIGFLRSVNPSSLHPPKIVGRHAVPSSLQVFTNSPLTAHAGSGEPIGLRYREG